MDLDGSALRDEAEVERLKNALLRFDDENCSEHGSDTSSVRADPGVQAERERCCALAEHLQQMAYESERSLLGQGVADGHADPRELERLLCATRIESAELDRMRQNEAELLTQTLAAAKQRAERAEGELLKRAASERSVGSSAAADELTDLRSQLESERELRSRFAELSVKLDHALSEEKSLYAVQVESLQAHVRQLQAISTEQEAAVASSARQAQTLQQASDESKHQLQEQLAAVNDGSNLIDLPPRWQQLKSSSSRSGTPGTQCSDRPSSVVAVDDASLPTDTDRQNTSPRQRRDEMRQEILDWVDLAQDFVGSAVEVTTRPQRRALTEQADRLLTQLESVSSRALFQSVAEGEPLIALSEQAKKSSDIGIFTDGLAQLDNLVARVVSRERDVLDLLRASCGRCRGRVHRVLCHSLDIVHASSSHGAPRSQRQRFAVQIEETIQRLDGRMGVLASVAAGAEEHRVLVAKLMAEVELYTVHDGVTTAELAWISKLLSELRESHEVHWRGSWLPKFGIGIGIGIGIGVIASIKIVMRNN